MATMNKSKVAEIARKQKEISKKGLSAQYDNSISAWSFYNSDQSSYSDRIQYLDTWGRRKRSLVTFNKIQQNVDSVVGFMAQNRRQAKFVARVPNNMGQQLYSKNMNALYDYTRENTNSDQLETQQDLDMMVCGYGAIDTDISYTVGNATKMPNGEIVKKKLATDCVYWDPRARYKNLMDKRWCGYYEDYELADALNLFQDSKEADFEQVADDAPEESNYVFNPYGGIYSKIRLDDSVEWTSKEQNMVRVYNHQWMEYETFYKAANPLYETQDPLKAMFIQMKLDVIAADQKPVGDSLGVDMFAFDPRAEVLVFDDSIKARLVKELSVEPIPYKRKCFYWAVVSGEHVFSWGRCISQQDFSIKFKTGTYNNNKKIWVGMVNPMMEPQEYYNKALTEQLFAIASNSKGGVIIEESTTEDVADFEQKYAKTDGVVVVRDGAISGQTIMPKAQPQMNTGINEILQLAEGNIAQNGVDPAFLGDITKQDTSGVLYKRVIRQIISKFAMYVDSITLYQKEDARLHGDLIPLWVENNVGALARITGEEGIDDFIELTTDMLAPEYDVDIQEAPQSVDEKMETAQMLNSNALNLLTAQQVGPGLSFMKEALQFTRLDGDVKMRLSEALMPQDDPRIAMMQQQIQQLTQLVQSGQVEKTRSETEYNMARAMKTMKDADVSTVSVPKVQAETVKILEEAGRTAVESHVALTTPAQDTRVTI